METDPLVSERCNLIRVHCVLVFITMNSMQVPFGDKDQCGEFTLRHGDWVQFQVATDRRDQLKRATNISLLDESFNVSGER